MTGDLVPFPTKQLLRAGLQCLPTVIADAGLNAGEKFREFFTATIRNKHTRRAYAQAVVHFLDWCQERGLALHQIRPVVAAVGMRVDDYYQTASAGGCGFTRRAGSATRCRRTTTWKATSMPT